MKQISLAFIAIALLAVPVAAHAQEQDVSSGTVRVVHNGNTDIVFENAGTTNLNMPQLQAFDHFASSHPDVAARLSRQPSLLSDQNYVSSHPELAQFVAAHPDFTSDFEANPGNYLHLAPGVERRVESSSND